MEEQTNNCMHDINQKFNEDNLYFQRVEYVYFGRSRVYLENSNSATPLRSASRQKVENACQFIVDIRLVTFTFHEYYQDAECYNTLHKTSPQETDNIVCSNYLKHQTFLAVIVSS